jgi:hypothetical protein
METEFAPIFEDFAADLDALKKMLPIAEEGDSHPQSAKARIAAGNAATLLLAAVFEEYIRQMVKAAFREKSKVANGIKDFPPKIAANVWRQALEMLARVEIEDVEANTTSYEARLGAIVAFSLKKDITSDVGDVLAHNKNNMRPNQLLELFNQIGVKHILKKACEDQCLQAYFGSQNANDTCTSLTTALNDFIERRNLIAHAIGLNSSSGPEQLSQDIELLSTFGRALQQALERELGKLSRQFPRNHPEVSQTTPPELGNETP